MSSQELFKLVDVFQSYSNNKRRHFSRHTVVVHWYLQVITSSMHMASLLTTCRSLSVKSLPVALGLCLSFSVCLCVCVCHFSVSVSKSPPYADNLRSFSVLLPISHSISLRDLLGLTVNPHMPSKLLRVGCACQYISF